MSEPFDDLKRLDEMRDAGDISRRVYEKVKAELLSEMIDTGGEAANEHPESSYLKPSASRRLIGSNLNLSLSQGSLLLLGIIVVGLIVYLAIPGGDGEEAIDAKVLLEITVSDETETHSVSDAVVVVGDDTWSPDLRSGGDSHSFRPNPVGEPTALIIYPDGPDGHVIQVSLLTDEMAPVSGSVRHILIDISIYDREVIVSGIVIPDFEQIYDR